MPGQIVTIPLTMPLRVGGVNCYLIENQGLYVLIDTGMASHRSDLEEALANANCRPGYLKLVVLTHADSDHSGNAAFLRVKYGSRIAMHPAEARVAETGFMNSSRKNNTLLSKLLLAAFRLGPSDRFRPDLLVTDGYDLTPDGLDARVIHVPGHTSGSIGILTADGDLFCGDLMTNTTEPLLNSLIDDKLEANASVEKLKSLPIKTVFPGHGTPFAIEKLYSSQGDKK